MLRSVRRLVAMLTVLGLVLGFWLPPEHIHEHAGPHHSSLIHRHFLTHSVFGGISLSHTDDDPPRVLDSVGVTTSAAPALIRADPLIRNAYLGDAAAASG